MVVWHFHRRPKVFVIQLTMLASVYQLLSMHGFAFTPVFIL